MIDAFVPLGFISVFVCNTGSCHIGYLRAINCCSTLLIYIKITQFNKRHEQFQNSFQLANAFTLVQTANKSIQIPVPHKH